MSYTRDSNFNLGDFGYSTRYKAAQFDIASGILQKGISGHWSKAEIIRQWQASGITYRRTDMLADVNRGLAVGWSRTDKKLELANNWFNAVEGYRAYQKAATGILPSWEEAQDFVYRWRTESELSDEDLDAIGDLEERDYEPGTPKLR